MAKQTASEDALAKLHSKVAQVLSAQLDYQDAQISFDENGESVEGELRYSATPATIAASIKFLKDNSITCDIETNENMGNLRDKLSQKQQRSRLADPKVAARVIGE